MQTLKLTGHNHKDIAKQAARVIKAGGLVVFPTETVYGLGANALDEKAVKKIFEAKGRPSDNPVIVHIANKKDVSAIAREISPLQEKLMDKFWPGPLTIIFKKGKNISSAVSGGLDTVAVRLPAHDFAKDLIKASGVPIAAPSANISGRPSSTEWSHVFEDLEGKVDMIVDGGSSDIGLESTVVKVEKDLLLILRPGAITKEMLEGSVYPDVVLFAGDASDLRASPGTRYKHYAPKARLEILSTPAKLQKRKEELEGAGKKVGVFSRRNPEEASRHLFRDLRTFDREGADVILCLAFPKEGIGAALMDRIRKAAGI